MPELFRASSNQLLMLAFCRQGSNTERPLSYFDCDAEKRPQGGGRLESTRWDRPCLMPGQAVRILSQHMLLLKNDFSRVCTEPDSDLVCDRNARYRFWNSLQLRGT